MTSPGESRSETELPVFPLDPPPSEVGDSGFVPGYGIGFTRLYALRNLLQANIATLNTALLSHTVTAPVVGSSVGGQVLTSHVLIGLKKTLWKPTDPSPRGGPIRILVTSPDMIARQGLSVGAEPFFIGRTETSGYKQTFHTSLVVCLHPDVFKVAGGSDLDAQAEAELAVAETIADWLRAGVFHNVDNPFLVLTGSREYNMAGTNNVTGTDYDFFQAHYLRAGYVGWVSVGFQDGSICPGLHFVHEGFCA